MPDVRVMCLWLIVCEFERVSRSTCLSIVEEILSFELVRLIVLCQALMGEANTLSYL